MCFFYLAVTLAPSRHGLAACKTLASWKNRTEAVERGNDRSGGRLRDGVLNLVYLRVYPFTACCIQLKVLRRRKGSEGSAGGTPARLQYDIAVSPDGAERARSPDARDVRSRPKPNKRSSGREGAAAGGEGVIILWFLGVRNSGRSLPPSLLLPGRPAPEAPSARGYQGPPLEVSAHAC